MKRYSLNDNWPENLTEPEPVEENETDADADFDEWHDNQ